MTKDIDKNEVKNMVQKRIVVRGSLEDGRMFREYVEEDGVIEHVLMGGWMNVDVYVEDGVDDWSKILTLEGNLIWMDDKVDKFTVYNEDKENMECYVVADVEYDDVEVMLIDEKEDEIKKYGFDKVMGFYERM